MWQASENDSAPLPGDIATITAGFEFITGHHWLTAVPILFDRYFGLARVRKWAARALNQRILAIEPGLIGVDEWGADNAPEFNIIPASECLWLEFRPLILQRSTNYSSAFT